MVVRTRFAPSPTGSPESVHLGFVIRALWCYALAKKNNGQFILRIEDTDKDRSRSDTEQAIFTTLHDFGISWDEGPDIGGPYGPYRQSERLERYQAAAKILVNKGYAYYDFDAEKREKAEIKAAYEDEDQRETLKDRPKARDMDPAEAQRRVDAGEPHVVRIKIPEDKIFEFNDWILRKKIRVLGKEVPDLIILKSDGFPTYHLAVVVDDVDMKISHVLRGQEWISTTPIHLYIYEGLGYFVPEIGHFTVILDPRTGKKFSKRDMSAMFGVKSWLDKGYLKEAILNFLMLLGWAPKDNRELFTLSEFVEAFDQAGTQRSNPTFDPKKLDWFNQQYLRALDNVTLAKRLAEFTTHSESDIAKVLPLVKDRLVTLKDFDSLTDFFFTEPTLDLGLFKKDSAKSVITHALSVLEKDWDGKVLEEAARKFCEEKNIKVGDYFMNLRVGLTGRTATPPLWEVMEVIGKETTLQRLAAACNLVS